MSLAAAAPDEVAPNGSDAPPELASQLESSFRRNAAAAVAWEATWAIGAACCLWHTLVPAYLLSLGAPKTLLQVVTVSFRAGAVLQLLSPRVSHHPRRLFRVFVVWCVFCGAWLAYGLLALFGWGRLPAGVWLPLFVVMCLCLAVTMNLGGPPYAELLLENIPLRRRGRLSAWRSIAAGTFGILGSLLAARLMRLWPEPTNSHASMVIGASIMLVSCLVILAIRDHAAAVVHAATPTLPPLRVTVRRLLRDRRFRTFLGYLTVLLCAQALTPLLLGYAREVLAMDAARMAWFNVALFVGSAVFVGTLAPVADHRGFRLLGTIGAGMLAVMFLIPLVLPTRPLALIVAYSLYGGSVWLLSLVTSYLACELMPDLKPVIIIALCNILTLPVSLVVAPLTGAFADLWGVAGYRAAFGCGLGLSLVALYGFACRVTEPRHEGHCPSGAADTGQG